MRELKFRRWSNGEPIYFDLANYCKEGDHLEIECFVFAEGPIEQYTGEKDKNGKEIYEGDILESTMYDGGKINDQVRFEDGCFAAGLAVSTCWEFEDTLLVIGNIHENPELLDGA